MTTDTTPTAAVEAMARAIGHTTANDAMEALEAAGFAVVALPEPSHVDAEGVQSWCGRTWDVVVDPTRGAPRVNIVVGTGGLGDVLDRPALAAALLSADREANRAPLH